MLKTSLKNIFILMKLKYFLIFAWLVGNASLNESNFDFKF